MDGTDMEQTPGDGHLPERSGLTLEVVALASLSTPDRAALAGLLERSRRATGHPALPEPQRRAVTEPGEHAPGWRVVLAGPAGGTGVVGAAFLSRALDGSTVVHLVADPAVGLRSLGPVLLGAAVDAAAPESPIHLWASQAGPEDDDRARAGGFAPERDLLQMRVALPLSKAVVAATRPLTTRPFAPGHDERAWVDVNNRAFAGHPEQGGWTPAQLRARMEADWFEPDGFLVADNPDGDGLIGSCWTKVHREGAPVLGEIYVIAVDPRHHGHGWGRSLTVAGLESLARRGVRVGMLYTDADNAAAVSLYRSLGFEVDHVDRSYRRDPSRP